MYFAKSGNTNHFEIVQCAQENTRYSVEKYCVMSGPDCLIISLNIFFIGLLLSQADIWVSKGKLIIQVGRTSTRGWLRSPS